MNKEERKQLADFITKYLGDDVFINYNRLASKPANLSVLILEAINEYYNKEDKCNKAKEFYRLLKDARESCAGCTANTHTVKQVIKKLESALKFSNLYLDTDKYEGDLMRFIARLINTPTLRTRILVDGKLCNILNGLDKTALT